MQWHVRVVTCDSGGDRGRDRLLAEFSFTRQQAITGKACTNSANIDLEHRWRKDVPNTSYGYVIMLLVTGARYNAGLYYCCAVPPWKCC